MRRLLSVLLFAAAAAAAQSPDWRFISNGLVIPDESYADQPYIVSTADGAWLCVLTTGRGSEGAGGQHVISVRSTDRGRTWETPVDVEPASGPEASYAVALAAPSGRIYVFYNHNTDNVREVIADRPAYRDGLNRRVDSLGHFVFKFSDDHGRSWSARRFDIPQRDFEIDRLNPYGGKLKFFWNVGKPFILRGAAYVPLHKVGGFGAGFFTSSEGVLLHSANLLTERDPERIVWRTLPDGDKGIRAPEGGGPIAEEQSFAVLSDGSLFCVFRTIDGHSAFTYSRDGGRTWEPSLYMRYDDGRLMKHPRAANFVWKCSNGKFLYWFHNHGGRFIREHPNRRTIAYDDRNPAWLCGGVEAGSPQGRVIRWSQPEILLYDDDPTIRMSYPDLVQDGGYFVSETQKEIARLHELDASLLAGLWAQFDSTAVATAGLALELPAAGEAVPASAPAPPLPLFLRRAAHAGQPAERTRAGVTLDLWLRLPDAAPGRVLLDNRTPDGKGFLLATAPGGTLELVMNDGRTENRWSSDPGLLRPGTAQHVAAIVDAGPAVVSFVIDGQFCDGGEARQFGWGRFSPHLMSLQGGALLKLAAASLLRLRVYTRALRTSEAVSAWRHGL